MESCTMAENQKVAIIGSGTIGKSWAMLFAAAGSSVFLYDTESSKIHHALDDIRVQLESLRKADLLKGRFSVQEQLSKITVARSFKECVTGAMYVQECVPEELDLKKKIFKQLDACVEDNVILASSTSTMPASTFTSDMKHRKQAMVVHPVNPPDLIPLVELIPSPWTDVWVVDKTRELMNNIGQTPIALKKEIPGFVVNRIQFALMDECWRLLEQDIVSVEDMDKAMSEGLGMRYAFNGPFETCHLHTTGWRAWIERYGDYAYEICSSFGPAAKWEGATSKRISQDISKKFPPRALKSHQACRIARLAALAKLKRDMQDTTKDEH